MSVTINGKTLEFKPGQTIYQVAKENGIYIPVLCHHDQIKPSGACRMCLVEVSGSRNLVASCSMPASNGMGIQTDSERVRKARYMIVEMLMTEGHHNCIACEKSGTCVLQEQAYKLGIEHPQFDPPSEKKDIEAGNEMIIRDMNKCVRCGICVRACNEIQVNEVLGFTERGFKVSVGPAFEARYEDSTCVFCGECVRLCPVGALYEKQGHFMGRANELKIVQTTCEYCGVGCQLDLNLKDDQIVKITTPREDAPPPNNGSLCIKGRFGFDFISHPDRLKTPMIRKNGELKEASWDEAIGYIADKLAAINKKNGADSIAGLASGRVTNEENYLFQKMLRTVIGTNNVDHCARL